MAAFNLFGKIAIMASESTMNASGLIENYYFHIISVLLHLSDEKEAVRSACHQTLENISIIIKAPDLK